MAEAATNRAQTRIVYDAYRTQRDIDMDSKAPNMLFASKRIDCMTGQRTARQERIYDPERMPDSGIVCLKLLEVSADNQNNRQLLEHDPYRGLLGAYRYILEQKKIPASDETARSLVEVINQTAQLENVRNRSDSVRVKVVNSTVDIGVFPGNAFDAAFTKMVLDKDVVLGAVSAALPMNISLTEPAQDASLDDITRACYRNSGVTIGDCHAAGKAQAEQYLQKRNPRAK